MMLYTKYQGSMPCDFRQEDFFMFSVLADVKQEPPSAEPVLAPGV